jgi:hypothetical protein
MTVFAVEHPFMESAGFLAQLFDLGVAESALREVAQEASQDYEGFYAQRRMPPEESVGELLVVSFDGKGVPIINHRRWKPYDAHLAMGLPVRTGVIESVCGSVVKHRMEREGKQWSMEGAEAILALRSLKKSHDHDLREDWQFRACQVRVRLYASKPKYRPTARLRHVA